jgi:hypothetical protein
MRIATIPRLPCFPETVALLELPCVSHGASPFTFYFSPSAHRLLAVCYEGFTVLDGSK